MLSTVLGVWGDLVWAGRGKIRNRESSWQIHPRQLTQMTRNDKKLLFSNSGPPVVVKIGMTNLEEVAPYIKVIEIAEIIDHPDYTPSGKYHDIALYKLQKSIKFNEYSRPACISSVPVQWSQAIVIGFGKTDYG